MTDERARSPDPPPPPRPGNGAFVGLVFVWLALDVPLYALRGFFGFGNAILLLWYLIFLPWIAVVGVLGFAWAVVTAVRMMFSENQQRRGIVAVVLCLATGALTLQLARWWVSPAMRAEPQAEPAEPKPY